MDFIYIFDLPWIALDKIVKNLAFIDRIKLSISYPPIKQLVRKKNYDFYKCLHKKLLNKIDKNLVEILLNKLGDNNYLFGTFLFECLFDFDLESDINLISHENKWDFFSRTEFEHNYRRIQCPWDETKSSFIWNDWHYKDSILKNSTNSANSTNSYFYQVLACMTYNSKGKKINYIDIGSKELFYPIFDNISTIGMITFDGKKLSIRNLDDLIYRKYTLLSEKIIMQCGNMNKYTLSNLKKLIIKDFSKLEKFGFVWDKTSFEMYKKMLNKMYQEMAIKCTITNKM